MRDKYVAPDEFDLSDDDGLFVWYGEYPGAFPYRMQNDYDRSSELRDIDSCILENDHLKAVFIPGLGAKLWSLYDKESKKELLFENDIIRPCNLAVRNAWTAGGIEWNFGFRGHHPYTCDSVHTAETALEDGTPVLRFYWFERARACVVQMDCFLPEDSKVLYVRTRITNPQKFSVPVYWWTNIAVKREDGDRVIVPAKSYFTAEGVSVVKRDIAFGTNKDQTYPGNGIIAKDYFWKTSDDGPHFIAQLGKDGSGMFEASTGKLKGRKLFIWGDSEGGRKWQRYLTSDGKSGAYDEIQCGLAHTQYECIPMPPRTAWEFLECFGALRADNDKIFGDYDKATMEVFRVIDESVGFDHLEKLLSDTRNTSRNSAAKVIRRGDCFGALELLRRKKAGAISGLMCENLDFGEPDSAEAATWVSLLETGSAGIHDVNDVPESYMYQPEWTAILKKAVEGPDADNWYTVYLLGTSVYYDGQFDEAEKLFRRSLSLAENPWSYYCLALLSEERGRKEDAYRYIEKAYSLKNDDLSLAKEYVRILQCCGFDDRLSEVYNTLPSVVLSNNRCRLNLAISLARSGRIEEAESILYSEKDGYLLVPDIREGEESITKLWFEIQKKKGLSPDEAGDPPSEIDFRMFSRKNER
ncbi:MAG: DUF5107 domain-containing protein [Clostridia bacterium]|nr:DUF5107 domain-containing protein [Clostridia bacterium]